jgi:hypothetical protein
MKDSSREETVNGETNPFYATEFPKGSELAVPGILGE